MHYSVNSQIESSYISAHQFLLCETCFWSATLFKSTQKNAGIEDVLFMQIEILNLAPIALSASETKAIISLPV
jgi:hypothetical protein